MAGALTTPGIGVLLAYHCLIPILMPRTLSLKLLTPQVPVDNIALMDTEEAHLEPAQAGATTPSCTTHADPMTTITTGPELEGSVPRHTAST